MLIVVIMGMWSDDSACLSCPRCPVVKCVNNNNNNIYLKSNIQCTYRYEFSGLYNNNIQLQ